MIGSFAIPDPVKSRKRKIDAGFLDAQSLREHGKALFNLLQAAYFKKSIWKDVNTAIIALANSLTKYCAYLESQCKRVKQNQSTMIAHDNQHFKIIDKSDNWAAEMYRTVYEDLQLKDVCDPLFLDEHAPSDRKRRYEYISKLKLPIRTLLFTHSGGALHSHFLWKIEEFSSAEEILNTAHNIATEIVKDLPKYHSRAMRREFVQSFGVVANKAVLRQGISHFNR